MKFLDSIYEVENEINSLVKVYSDNNQGFKRMCFFCGNINGEKQ